MSEGLLPRVFAAMITGSQRSYEHKTVSRRKQTSAPEGAEEKALLSRSFSKKRGGGLRLPKKLLELLLRKRHASSDTG
ncbi:hypothetical protein [Succinimonas amylolytica]|uniref:hypothetical protein n=1 Tax=Succinimonas amylolytica TaxID=83769 RepID=UPI0023A81682